MWRDSIKLLWDMSRAAERIARYSAGKTLEDYQRDDMMRSAIERQFEIIGEAMSRLVKSDNEGAARITDYRKISGFRNALIHGYDAIDDVISWRIVEEKLPLLLSELNMLLANENEQGKTLFQSIAIQSWCYRHFKEVPDFLAQLKAAGVTATEICGVHANFNDPATAAPLAKRFSEAGVSIVALGVERMTGELAKDRPRFEWAKAAGVKNISITFGPEAMFDGLKNVDALAAEFGIKVGIHNHGGYDWLGNDTILKYIFSKTNHIGLHIDTAWALAAKQDPIKWLETFGPRVVGVHIKDFIFDRAGNPQDVIIGTGNLDLPAFVAGLKKINFTGPLVIEYEGDEQNPVPALSECVKKLRALM